MWGIRWGLVRTFFGGTVLRLFGSVHDRSRHWKIHTLGRFLGFTENISCVQINLLGVCQEVGAFTRRQLFEKTIGNEGERWRRSSSIPRRDAGLARGDAELARGEADRARREAGLAREDAEASRLKQAELSRQLAELNAKETARGIVITLGDVLFATGRSELTGSAPEGLRKLAAFLGEYPDRQIAIEGHTDSVGSAESNVSLSERRAASVQTFLANQGVASKRMRTVGMGEGSPIASNDSSTGRQQNRRVEVIIENSANN